MYQPLSCTYDMSSTTIRALVMTPTETPPDPLPLPSRLLESPTFLLWKLGIEARRRSSELLESEEGLTTGHLGILITIDEFGPSSQRELGERLRFDPSDVVALIDALETAGLVERKPDAADRRRYAITITKKGAALVRRHWPRAAKLNAAFLEVLDEPEQAAFTDMLYRLFAEHDGRVQVTSTTRERPPTARRA
jgi:DNA-binding MarR family transcriptional regulator